MMYDRLGRPMFQNVMSGPNPNGPRQSTPGTEVPYNKPLTVGPVPSQLPSNPLANWNGDMTQLPKLAQQYGAASDNEEINKLMAQAPRYQGITDLRGNLRPQYSLNADPYMQRIADTKLDNTAYDAIRKQALWDPATQGDSPWTKLMKQQSLMEQQNAAEALAQNSAANAAKMRSDLAARGGLSGGAALSLAKLGSRELARGQQQLSRDAMMQNMGIGIKDYEMRQNMLKDLSGLDMTRYGLDINKQKDLADLGLGAQKFNIGNVIQDRSNQYNANLGIWKMLGELTGSYRNARAVEANS